MLAPLCRVAGDGSVTGITPAKVQRRWLASITKRPVDPKFAFLA